MKRTTFLFGTCAVIAIAAMARSSRPVSKVAADPSRVATSSKHTSNIAPPARVLVVPWGSQDGEASRRNPVEGAPEAPMSFAVDTNGRIHLLDQVAARIVTFEAGAPPVVTPIGIDTAQDVDVYPDGRFVVLDRLVDRAVRFVAPRTGTLLARVPVAGLGVGDPGGITALFARRDGAWIEVEHGPSIRVARRDGTPDEARLRVPGRFAADGRFVRADRDANDVIVASHPREGGKGTLRARIAHGAPIAAITGLDVDDKGRAFVSSWRIDRTSGPSVERHTVTLLDDRGDEIARAELPPTTRPEETFRTVKLGHDGALYAMVPTDAGVEFWRWAP